MENRNVDIAYIDKKKKNTCNFPSINKTLLKISYLTPTNAF